MSKKNIYIVACLIIVITVFSSYGLFNSDRDQEMTKSESDTEQNQENNENKGNENEEELIFGSMQDVLVYNKPLKCSYIDISDEGAETIGTIYVADNKRRTEFEIINKETNEKIKMNSIHIGEWMYSWNNSSTEGMKMNLKEMYGDEQFEKYSQEGTASMKKKIDFKCRIWIFDNSKFSFPSDIEFKDIKI